MAQLSAVCLIRADKNRIIVFEEDSYKILQSLTFRIERQRKSSMLISYLRIFLIIVFLINFLIFLRNTIRICNLKRNTILCIHG